MRRYRFSWNAFADDVVSALAREVGHRDDATESARDFLARKVKRPSPDFVKEHKDAILDFWVAKHEGTARALYQQLVDAGRGPLDFRPRSLRGYVTFLKDTRNAKLFQETLAKAMIAFGDADRVADEDPDHSFLPRFAIIDTQAQADDDRRPHDYQSEAWSRLGAHLAESRASGVFQGLLVMPTGSGKTFTAVRWITTHVLANGGRVLWLAHREELLRHAAEEFHRVASFASPKERLRIRIVSGANHSATSIDPEDDVVVASVASLARRPDIRSNLARDPRLFVVVDEAHHAAATSYRALLNELAAQKKFRVLGLTATPTRTLEDERPVLSRLFGQRILFQVGLRTLIERGTLSRPRIVRVATGADAEAGVTAEDLKHLSKFQDLSQEWFDRIAHLAERNDTIIKHYLENRHRYGPTLIFAINIQHAALLTAQLREHGVAANYVASYRPDDSADDNREVIEQFRTGALDVLVNVQMVTEGVDVPRIQSVFLARPTSSEILLRQMIGRALRGPAAGGTAEAFLVSFEDDWRHFNEWESPFELVTDIVAAAVPDEPDEPATGGRFPLLDDPLMDALPWDLVATTARELRRLRANAPVLAFESVPHGWYVFEHEGEEDHDAHIVPYYAHQAPCWEACFDYLWSLSDQQVEQLETEGLDEFFVDCDEPQPATRDRRFAITLRARGGARPAPIPFTAREMSAPESVARRILDEDLGARAADALVESSYDRLARAVYPTLREYQRAVDDARYAHRHPKDAIYSPKAVPIFELGDDRFLTPGPHHDLGRLMAGVLPDAARLLGIPACSHEGSLEWTRRPVKGWYGIAHLESGKPPGHGRIRMNRRLDSPDVPESVLRFLLWHEYLHLHLQDGHTPVFRELERQWPGHIEADRFLDTLNERFGYQAW